MLEETCKKHELALDNLSLLRRYSIVSPSVVHRYSIVTMDHRWSIDGESMEYLPCFCLKQYYFSRKNMKTCASHRIHVKLLLKKSRKRNCVYFESIICILLFKKSKEFYCWFTVWNVRSHIPDKKYTKTAQVP